jgi:hypothetical protein
MKFNKQIGILFLAVAMIASSCTKTYEKYAVNPNQPTAVPAYLLLRQIENSLMVFPAGILCLHTLTMVPMNIGLEQHL